MNKAVILLSGGLYSVVALGHVLKNRLYDVKLALTFDYGQKSFAQEKKAVLNLTQYYKIDLEIIELPDKIPVTNVPCPLSS